MIYLNKNIKKYISHTIIYFSVLNILKKSQIYGYKTMYSRIVLSLNGCKLQTKYARKYSNTPFASLHWLKSFFWGPSYTIPSGHKSCGRFSMVSCLHHGNHIIMSTRQFTFENTLGRKTLRFLGEVAVRGCRRSVSVSAVVRLDPGKWSTKCAGILTKT